MLEKVEDIARSRGCCKLTLEVRADNPGAAGLYRKLGFGPGHSSGRDLQYLFLEKRFLH